MAVMERRSQVSDRHVEISEKLCSIGNMLQNSSLSRQTKILNKLIYKYKNQHGREKYFKCLQMIKKSLIKWKMLSLDEKIITEAKNICDTDLSSSDCMKDLMIAIKDGGKLVIRNIVLCQEAVQYSLGFLSLGFFVTLHVTLFALVSRIWIFLKDCLSTLVECYQLVRLVFQSETTCNHNTLTQFPECLSLLLRDDLKDVYNISSEHSEHISLTLNADTMLGQETGDDELINSVMINDGIDLGEPIQNISQVSCCGDFNDTPKPNRETVSGLTKDLTLKFDMELVDNDKTGSDCALQSKNVPAYKKPKVNKKTLIIPGRQAAYDVKYAIKSLQKLPKTNPRLRFRYFFMKKPTPRYSLRTLATMNTYYSLHARKIHGLLAIIKHALRSELAVANRKILLRAQRKLKKVLCSREGNGHANHKVLIPRRQSRYFGYSHRVGTTSNCLTTEIAGECKTNVAFAEHRFDENRNSRIKRLASNERTTHCDLITSNDTDYNDCNQVNQPLGTPHDAGTRSDKELLNDERNHSYRTGAEPDEIDDIFGSLGF